MKSFKGFSVQGVQLGPWICSTEVWKIYSILYSPSFPASPQREVTGRVDLNFVLCNETEHTDICSKPTENV